MVVPRPTVVNDVNGMEGGIRGWLLLLVLLLTVWHPINLAVGAARALGALETRGLSLALVVLCQLLVAGVGVAAGMVLFARRRGAVTFAKWSLVLSAAMDLVVYTTSIVPSNRQPGTTPLFAISSLAYSAIWIAYLSRSKRVRNTFSAGSRL